MTSTKTKPNKIAPSQIQRYKPVGVPDLHVPRTTCSYIVDHMVKEISSPTVREIVGTVFEDLLRLLECLSLIETRLRHADAGSETIALFQIIHDEARAVVKYISDEALTCEAMSEEVFETLDGITFAINHDLHRVFDNQQLGGEATEQVVVGELFRAHDLLTNCLQQSTISLAIPFDRTLDGTKLFDNSGMRYRQSIQLCEEISALLQLVEACGGRRAERRFANLKARVELFRHESLECLMYSDWPQFEGFCERINSPEISTLELKSVLHQFRCYLETLLGQVRMRAVFSNVLPAHFGPHHIPQTPDEQVAWDPFAVAV